VQRDVAWDGGLAVVALALGLLRAGNAPAIGGEKVTLTKCENLILGDSLKIEKHKLNIQYPIIIIINIKAMLKKYIK
jgi:hypothetical protein